MLNKGIKNCLLVCCFLTIILSPSAYSNWLTNFSVLRKVEANAPNLNPSVLELALAAYEKAHYQGLDKQGLLTIVNFALPSTQKRLWVINLKTGRVLFHTLVANGIGGSDSDNSFSNRNGSHRSSLGLFETGHTYYGADGYSLRLHGLEKGFNSNAFRRNVVVHGAWYVSQKFAKLHGRLGRTWGCFGLSLHKARKVINTIKQGSLLFSYYPDKAWLQRAEYV